MSLIKIRKLWKSYGAKNVLEGLDFSIDANEFVTIVGASGCGKTTFLRMILGEEEPSRGSIEIDGEKLIAEPGKDRGVVFQRYSVFPHLTVLENVMLGLEFAGSKILCRSFGSVRKQRTQRCREMLDRVGLLTSANDYPDALSGGMQQRLALAQSLMVAPRILLLDEPFGALDPGIRSDMHVLVRELHRELGLTVLMVTHDISEGFYLGTRVLVLDKIRIDPHDPDLFGANITYDIPVRNPLDDIAGTFGEERSVTQYE